MRSLHLKKKTTQNRFHFNESLSFIHPPGTCSSQRGHKYSSIFKVKQCRQTFIKSLLTQRRHLHHILDSTSLLSPSKTQHSGLSNLLIGTFWVKHTNTHRYRGCCTTWSSTVLTTNHGEETSIGGAQASLCRNLHLVDSAFTSLRSLLSLCFNSCTV